VVALGVVVEVVVGALVDVGLLDHFDRAPAGGNLHAVGDAAHIDLGHRVALAGVDVFGDQHDVELAVVVLDDVALAQRRGDDLDHISSLFNGWRRPRERRRRPADALI